MSKLSCTYRKMDSIRLNFKYQLTVFNFVFCTHDKKCPQNIKWISFSSVGFDEVQSDLMPVTFYMFRYFCRHVCKWRILLRFLLFCLSVSVLYSTMKCKMPFNFKASNCTKAEPHVFFNCLFFMFLFCFPSKILNLLYILSTWPSIYKVEKSF